MSLSCSTHCLRNKTIAAIITRNNAQTKGAQAKKAGIQASQGTRLPLAQSFVEGLQRSGILRHQPGWNMGLDQLSPLILGRGVIKGNGYLDEKFCNEEGGDGRGHDHQNVDQQEFPAL